MIITGSHKEQVARQSRGYVWTWTGPLTGGTQVIAHSPIGLEFQTSVTASLLTDTWSGDFSSDFGPDFGGGAPIEWLTEQALFVADSFSPIEGLTAALADHLSPIEGLTAATADNLSPIEALETSLYAVGAPAEMLAAALTISHSLAPIEGLTTSRYAPGGALEGAALFSADLLSPAEAGIAVRGGHAHPLLETKGSTRADPPIAAEAQATLLRDELAIAEALIAARGDAPVAAEGALTARGAPMPPSEVGGALQRVDRSAPAEFMSLLPLVPADNSAPIEALLAARSDNAPVEWIAIFRADAIAPSAAIVVIRADPPAHGESGAVYRLDVVSPIEGLTATRADPPLGLESLLSAARDGAYLELLAGPRSDAPAATEAGSTLRGDTNLPAEAVAGAARSDALAPIEALLSAMRDGSYVEWVAAAAKDAIMAAEAGSILRADPNIPAEAVSGAARADVSMPIEGQLSVRGRGAVAEFLAMLLDPATAATAVEAIAVMRADGTPVIEVTALSGRDLATIAEWLRAFVVENTLPPIEGGTTARAPVFFVASGRLR